MQEAELVRMLDRKVTHSSRPCMVEQSLIDVKRLEQVTRHPNGAYIFNGNIPAVGCGNGELSPARRGRGRTGG